MEFVGGDFSTLADFEFPDAELIIRNATYFPPLLNIKNVPIISILQDIMEDGPQRKMQEEVMASSTAIVFNSMFTLSKYKPLPKPKGAIVAPSVIPLPVDFDLFVPGNPMGLQQHLQLPDNCICWVGASQGAAAQVKGYEPFLSIVRQNPDLFFVAVFKDQAPEYVPPNMRTFTRLSHEELVKVYGACRVGLCTSRTESQHLAGIEMGACGLPMVAPPVGVYYEREDLPGVVVKQSLNGVVQKN